MRLTVCFSVPGRVLWPSSAVRAVQTTFAPSIARRVEIASPMPRLAPVTSATLPLSLPLGLTFASAMMVLPDRKRFQLLGAHFRSDRQRDNAASHASPH